MKWYKWCYLILVLIPACVVVLAVFVIIDVVTFPFDSYYRLSRMITHIVNDLKQDEVKGE